MALGAPIPNYGNSSPKRGARIARRDDREYREYSRKEQRREAGCPARNTWSYLGIGALSDVRRSNLPATLVLSLALLASPSTLAAPVQGRRVVDVVTLGDVRSEREHEYAGERVTEGVVDGRIFRQAAGWLRVSLTVYDDTEVTLVGTFRGSQGEPIAFELLVEGRKVTAPAFVSPTTAPAHVEYRVPLALTRGKTRISVTLRAVNGPTPGLIELRTVQEHLEVW